MTFGRDLVRKMRGETLEKNPLLVIGISQAILDLNLTEDEIHEICQRHARFALSKAHPDTHEGKATAGTFALTEALNMLRDRQVFRRALAELRETHAFTSSNERTLQDRLGRLGEEANRLQGRLNAQEAAYAREARFRAWAGRYFSGGAMRFPSSKVIKSLAECKRLTVAKVTLDSSVDPEVTDGRLTTEQRETLQHASQVFPKSLDDRKVVLAPRELAVNDQMLMEGPEGTPVYLHMMGTVDINVGLSHAYSTLGVWISIRDEIIPDIEPFVAPGRAIISLPIPNPFRIRAMGRNAWNDVLEEREQILQDLKGGHNFYLSHVVLDVG